RGGQAGPDHAHPPARRAGGTARAAGVAATPPPTRPPRPGPHGLRARAPVPAHRPRSPPAGAAHPAAGERLSRRLLLAPSRPRRRDRRAALPPDPRAAGEGPPPRSGPRGGRACEPALHPRPGSLRGGKRGGDAARRDRAAPRHPPRPGAVTAWLRATHHATD